MKVVANYNLNLAVCLRFVKGLSIACRGPARRGILSARYTP